MKRSDYIAVLDCSIAGIPAKIGVFNYTKVPPWRGPVSKCPSDLDYRGYTESEWEVLDRKGYQAEWLKKKLNKRTEEEIEILIDRYFVERE